MVVTFPHMGNLYIGIKALLEDLKVDFVIPPFANDNTLELGSSHASEHMCTPLKLNIGNYIQSIEKGADTILITGSNGPCRFGYYGVMEQEILKDMGYDIEMVILEAPNGDITELIRRFQKVTNTKNIGKLAKELITTYRILCKVDFLEKKMQYLEAVEAEKGTIQKIRKEFKIQSMNAKGGKAIYEVLNEFSLKLDKVERNLEKSPLKIGLVGDIYTLIEPYINQNIEEQLANLGVQVDRSLYISEWIMEHVVYRPIGLTREKEIRKAAQPYLDHMVGGHGWETIGYASYYCENGYDGIIQLLPFGCMPEIVAESILPSIRKDYNVPIMTLVLDELSSDTGYQTRLEAFIDLIQRKKERRKFNGA
ncbi:acyl-CoA dehydratase activase-related protein [Garciella nitratireducens]|uniref:acyl-CoA dehydratase activase-related protein n=1 Tax=Garciella nitratireducens TaxID=218205 RepID=UPI000DE88AF1|nr:acyl-CoA dehydratase activase-related protein [Garciella nitratireducens]RBP45521.1 putative nucleotide-binding protein (sugar kinase/HSP70/actin superfamily) [Garciella nitratireducens]